LNSILHHIQPKLKGHQLKKAQNKVNSYLNSILLQSTIDPLSMAYSKVNEILSKKFMAYSSPNYLQPETIISGLP